MNNKFLADLFKANDALTEQMNYHDFCKQFMNEDNFCNGCPFLANFQGNNCCLLNKAGSALDQAKKIYQNMIKD